MASKIEAKVSAASPTTCKVCSKGYNNPRLLPCLHSFCLACIEKLDKEEGFKRVVCCVTCKHTSPLPEKGVEGIPQNVHLNYEAEIAEYADKIRSGVRLNCDECDRSEPHPVVAFCCTCPGFLCSECHNQHTISRRLKSHKVFTLEEATAFSDIGAELKKWIPPPAVTCSQHAGKQVDIICTTCSMLVCMLCPVVTHQGHKFKELQEFAKTKRMETGNGKSKIIDAVSKLDTVIKRGRAELERVDVRKKEVDDTVRRKFQQVYRLMQGREKRLLAENAEIAKVKSQRLTNQIKELSSLKDQISVCSGTVTEAQESHSDTEFLSIVTTLQARLEELTQQFDQTSLELQENAVIAVEVDTAILASDIAKLGRVATVTKSDMYKSLSKPVMTIKTRDPYHVAVHDNGDIYVPDNCNGCIYVYDQKGTKKRTIGSKGDGNGQFRKPIGIAIKGDVLYVTENGNHRVQKLTLDGMFITKFGKCGSGKGELFNPWGCTVSEDEKVYVADAGNDRVQVFNTDGTFSHTIEASHDTRDIAIDTKGYIHIAAKCIKVFTPGGEFIREYGNEQLQHPHGIAVDVDGYCLVGDWHGKALHTFDPQGKLVHSIKYTGGVCGVRLDKEGSAYVVEWECNAAVHKYTLIAYR